MLLNIPLQTDFHLLQARRQVVIDNNLWRSNQKRCHHDYRSGNECLILDHKSTKKLDTKYIGPFLITQAHTNGTVTIQRTPHVTDPLNIRQIKPAHPTTARILAAAIILSVNRMGEGSILWPRFVLPLGYDFYRRGRVQCRVFDTTLALLYLDYSSALSCYPPFLDLILFIILQSYGYCTHISSSHAFDL
jgi:hypothetical protein